MFTDKIISKLLNKFKRDKNKEFLIEKSLIKDFTKYYKKNIFFYNLQLLYLKQYLPLFLYFIIYYLIKLIKFIDLFRLFFPNKVIIINSFQNSKKRFSISNGVIRALPPKQFNYVDLKTIKLKKFVGFKFFFLIIFKSLYTGCYNVNLHFQYYFTKQQFKINKNLIINKKFIFEEGGSPFTQIILDLNSFYKNSIGFISAPAPTYICLNSKLVTNDINILKNNISINRIKLLKYKNFSMFSNFESEVHKFTFTYVRPLSSEVSKLFLENFDNLILRFSKKKNINICITYHPQERKKKYLIGNNFYVRNPKKISDFQMIQMSNFIIGCHSSLKQLSIYLNKQYLSYNENNDYKNIYHNYRIQYFTDDILLTNEINKLLKTY